MIVLVKPAEIPLVNINSTCIILILEPQRITQKACFFEFMRFDNV